MNCLYILLSILFIFIILALLNLDHFKSINSLKIKYNNSKIKIPNQLEPPTKKELSIKEKIIAELNKQPTLFPNQMYSMSVYPHVGEKQLCKQDKDCSMLSSECNTETDISKKIDKLYDRNMGVGVCTLKIPDETVFNIKF